MIVYYLHCFDPKMDLDLYTHCSRKILKKADYTVNLFPGIHIQLIVAV